MARCSDMEHPLQKWRALVEPVILDSAMPLAWDDVLRRPVDVFAGERSVIVTTDVPRHGGTVRTVWVAAGEMDEIRRLSDDMEASARRAGIRKLVYVGRRGWLRDFGYHEAAVVGVKEI